MIVYHVSFWWTRSLQTGYGSVASFFQFSHTGLSCEIYICCLLWDYTYLSGLTLREVIKGKRQGASEKVITNLWVYRLQSFVSKPLCWEILIWPGHFLCRNDRSWITFFFFSRVLCSHREAVLYNLGFIMMVLCIIPFGNNQSRSIWRVTSWWKRDEKTLLGS